MNISIVGLGKLGAPMLAVFANAGHHVVGVDVNPETVEKINNRIAPVDEPGLGKELRHRVPGVRWTANLYATTDLAKAVKRTDITFIIVPTPSDETGAFSLDYILPPCKIIAEAIQKKNRYHVVVITSTVMPGSTEGPIRKVFDDIGLPRSSYGLIYNPEFIALGSVIRDMKNPDVLLIGSNDEGAVDILEKVYEPVHESSPYIAVMKPTEAEIAKIALNTFITTKISYANMLARICDKVPGTNVDAITAAIGADSRVGRKYLKGGLPFGGPCFPRDNHALGTFMHSIDVWPHIPNATDTVNYEQLAYLSHIPGCKARVLIVGTPYKKGTNLTERAAGQMIKEYFSEAKQEVFVWNPGDKEDLEEAIKSADAIYFMLPYEEINDIPYTVLVGKRVIDCWRAFPQFNKPQIDYIGLGIGRAQ